MERSSTTVSLLKQSFENRLMQLTEQDPTGLLLLGELCEQVEAREDICDDQKELIYEAVELADYAHKGQKRGTDEYFGHPIRVGIRLAEEYDATRIAAGILHDCVEDNPLAVIRYLWPDAIEHPAIIGLSRYEQIEIAIAMLCDSERFSNVAPYVDAVTNRPYPPDIDTADESAKHSYRAEQIKTLPPNKLAIKNQDSIDNVLMLPHHEAFNEMQGDAKAVKHLRKIVAKYTEVLEVFREIALAGSDVVTLESVQQRERVINEARQRLGSSTRTEVEELAA